MTEYPKTVIVGDAKCPFCGSPGVTKADKRGKLYFHCPDEFNDCGIGLKPVSHRSDARVAKATIVKWRKSEWRKVYLGDAGAGDPVEPAEVEAEPEDDDGEYWETEEIHAEG